MTRIDLATKALAQALAVLGLGVLLCFAAMTILDGLLRFLNPIDIVRDAANLVAALQSPCCIPVAVGERSPTLPSVSCQAFSGAALDNWPTLLRRLWSSSS